MNADQETGKTFTTKDTKEHGGILEIEQNLLTTKDAKGAEEQEIW